MHSWHIVSVAVCVVVYAAWSVSGTDDDVNVESVISSAVIIFNVNS